MIADIFYSYDQEEVTILDWALFPKTTLHQLLGKHRLCLQPHEKMQYSWGGQMVTDLLSQGSGPCMTSAEGKANATVLWMVTANHSLKGNREKETSQEDQVLSKNMAHVSFNLTL